MNASSFAERGLGPGGDTAASAGRCLHCGSPIPAATSGTFCCTGCSAAHALIEELGLDAWYARRTLDPMVRPPRPEDEESEADVRGFVRDLGDGCSAVDLMVDGLQCGACVWLIEGALGREPGLRKGRINLTTRRLSLVWQGGPDQVRRYVGLVRRLGYRLVPFDPVRMAASSDDRGRELVRALAVAGFAAGNIMLLSIAVWVGKSQGMGAATRDLLHWISALIALPAVAYAGRPFFRSAFAALRAGRSSMDIPISVGVIGATGLSLWLTLESNADAYFDSAVTLLFFLLIGRWLDHRARGSARSAVEDLIALRASAVSVLGPDGSIETRPPHKVKPGERVLLAAGERIGVDGVIEEGHGSVDASLVTGESLPRTVSRGDSVHAGTVNLGGVLKIVAIETGEGTLLAEIVRLVEAAETSRSRYTEIADRVARLYTPVVHALALASLLGWRFIGSASWIEAAAIAIAVLIITCPCALALAVPLTRAAASSRLLAQGILVKCATALERIADVDEVVLDKTGTLTLGRPVLIREPGIAPDVLERAAALAVTSRHPLSRALAAAVPGMQASSGPVEEVAGAGLRSVSFNGETRLGSAAFCGVPDGDASGGGPELWFVEPGRAPVRFRFADAARPDAAETVARLRSLGLDVTLLSGDRPEAVSRVAADLGLADWRAEVSPSGKYDHLAARVASGRRPLMVGDGINDAAALGAAHASMSPASGSDITQSSADVVFQGERLGAVAETISVARRCDRISRQNLVLAILYNVLAVPLAVAGFVTPLVAAIAMSSSSLLVASSALRLKRRRGT